jgi:hypothetical protein
MEVSLSIISPDMDFNSINYTDYCYCISGTAEVGATVSQKADFNGDGYEDLAIGVPNDDVYVYSGLGYYYHITDGVAVSVIYGSNFGHVPIAGLEDQAWARDIEGVIGIAEEGELFGDQFGSALVHSE